MSIESLIRRALDYTDFEIPSDIDTPRVIVVGVGGAGCNAITRMKRLGLEAFTVAINTDMNHLRVVDADKKILLKKITRGRGAGGSMDLGERSALMARDVLRDLFKDVDIVFITTGLGGGTGTGATPVVADMARKSGAIVVSMVTMPFKIERGRYRYAKIGLRKIIDKSNTVIVLENDKLLDIVPNRSLPEAFMVMDELMSYTIMSFIDMITKPSQINVDLADLRHIMENGNLSTILIGEGDVNNYEKVVIDALNRPFLMDVDYSSAKGALIHITVGEDVPINIVYSTVDAISSFLRKDASITLGTRVTPEFNNRMRILVIVTGIKVPLLEEAPKKVGRKTLYGIPEIE